MIKSEKYRYFSIKSLCCGCLLESPHQGDSNTHPKHMPFSGELTIIKVKTLVFCEKFMSTETFTLCFIQRDILHHRQPKSAIVDGMGNASGCFPVSVCL